MDAVKVRGQEMTVAPSFVRVQLLEECKPFFSKMRELAKNHFPKKLSSIEEAIGEYEYALAELTEKCDGQITVDMRSGEGNCAACGTPITVIPLMSNNTEYGRVVVCGECDKQFMNAEEKLDYNDGFGTWAI